MAYLTILRRTRYMQYVATLTASLSNTCGAMFSSWPSPTLPQLTSSDSPIGIQLTTVDSSWVASSYLMGFIPGAIISGWILNKFGPKTALLISAVPMYFPWLAIIFAKSALTLCIARVVAGIGMAIASTAVPVYIAEVSDKDIRGKLGTLFSVSYSIGGLFVFCIGPFVSYLTLAITCSFFPLLFGIMFWFMPDSPYYLVRKNQNDAARNNLVRLCAQNADRKLVQEQLDEVNKTIEYDMKNRSTLLELLTRSEHRRPLIIMAGVKLFQQFCGAAALEVYTQTIIGSSKSSISPEHSSIILGIIPIPSALIVAAVVDRLGRRPLYFISSIGCVLALLIEGIYFYLYDNAENYTIIDSLSWLPTTGLVLFLIMNPLGLSTLPYILVGELFATNIKGHAVSLSTFQGGVLGFLVILLFDPISKVLGMFAMFFIFSAFTIVGCVFVFVMLPETKGKTFVEIQASFNKEAK